MLFSDNLEYRFEILQDMYALTIEDDNVLVLQIKYNILHNNS